VLSFSGWHAVMWAPSASARSRHYVAVSDVNDAASKMT